MIALVAGATVYLAIAGYVFRHRRSAGGRALVVLTLAAGVWTVCGAAEVAAADPAVQERWGEAKYLGVVVLPPALLVFALEYTGRRRRVGRRAVTMLLGEPVLVLAALLVPATHHLVRYVPAGAPYGQYAVAKVGPLFWVHAGYSYLLVLSAVALLVSSVLRAAPRSLRGWSLIVACVLPLLANAAYNAELISVEVDPTPLGFSVAALVLVWGFFRFRLHELVPIGRRQVVDRIPDSVLVVDTQGRVVDANPAVARLLGQPVATVIGRDLPDVLPQVQRLVDPVLGAAGPPAVGSHRSDTIRVPSTEPDGSRCDLDLAVTVSPLPDDLRAPTGLLVVLRDITVQRNVERQLRELVRERNAIIETLRRGLQPVRMPAIPGMEVAALLDPAEADTSIGGDFVDVRPSGPSRWTLMVGDVAGKGAEAATLTAMARHTAVALSALGWRPAAVLAQVNRAIAIEEQTASTDLEARFCTIALATVEPDGDGAQVVLSLGGHPRPLLADAAGQVREVGVPGSLLGVLAEPELHEVTVRLRPGECLVMFTDGVVEARDQGEAYGDRRLAEVVSTLSALSAGIVVEELVADVRQYTSQIRHRDDVAVLVLRVPPRRPGQPPGR
ncbi:MAG: histidine kinase N-terminal 7TM domain-containing protein [Angustibacter sp.]